MTGSTGRLAACVLTLSAAAIVTGAKPAFAAFEFVGAGARAGAMGDACSAVAEGAEAAFWNPASVVWLAGFGAVLGTDRPFGMKALETQRVGVAWSGGRMGVSAGLTAFGPEAYREATASIAASWRPSRRASFGVALRRLSLTGSGIAGRQWYAFDLGVCVTTGGQVRVSLWARNAGGTDPDAIARGGSLGIAWMASDRIRLSAEVLKEADLPPGLGAGLELSVRRGVWLRGGAGGEPERTCLGFGMARGAWVLDYAALYHTVLGLSHRVTLSLHLRPDEGPARGFERPRF